MPGPERKQSEVKKLLERKSCPFAGRGFPDLPSPLPLLAREEGLPGPVQSPSCLLFGGLGCYVA